MNIGLGIGIPFSRSILYQALSTSLYLDFVSNETLDSRITFTRASSATRVNSSGLIETVASNAPRFDYDPVTLQPKGLLIEEQRTNLLTYSSGTYVNGGVGEWSNNGSFTTVVTAPNGTLTAEQFSFSAGTTQNIFKAVSCDSNTKYTLSLYYKLGTIPDSDLKMAVRDDTAGVFIVSDVIPTKTTTNDGWVRAILVFTTPVGCVLVRPYLIRNTMSFGGTVAFWGAQLEAGAFPTSYIPTTTAAATRAADIAVMKGANFSSWYRQDEGTLFAEAVGINDISGATRRFAEVTSGSSSDRYLIGFNATNSSRFIVSAGNVIQTDITVSASAGTITKIAAAYKFNSFQQATNGVTGVEDTFGSVPTVNQIIFGGDGNLIGGNTTLNGHIRRIAYFPRRLNNAELQGITA